MQRLREISLEGMDFSAVKGLRTEAVEKLIKVAPGSLGQAMNISGVSPADISVLMLEISRRRRESEEKR